MEECLRISTRSRRQAMDWSLVLASQEIPVVVTDDEGWGLLVAAGDHDRAMAAIGQYQAENRRWNWQRPLPGSSLLFHWGSIIWCLLLIFFYYWSTAESPEFRDLGMMSATALSEGQWWRLFTAVMLHGDLAHLAANCSTGFLLLGLAMARYGAGPGLLAAFLAGAAGNLAGWALYDPSYRSLGASGMILGALGMIAVSSIVSRRKLPVQRSLVLRGAGAGILILALLGFSPGTDIVAHVGGFLSGCVVGGLLALLPARSLEHPGANAAALGLLATGIIGTWFLALAGR